MRGILILVEFGGTEHTICKEMMMRVLPQLAVTGRRVGTSSLKSHRRLCRYSNDFGRFN